VPAIFLALVFMGRAFSFAHSDAPSLPARYRLEPSPAVVALTAGDEAPDASSLLDAAILFSGANPARTEAAKKRGIDAVGKARSLTGSEPDAYTRGKIVLDMVHSIISSYSELETRLDVALLDGRYNCVGSSTLYAILARAAGLEVRGVILPDHAYCYLMIDGKRVDVETTVADGYDATVHRLASGSAKGIDTGTRGVVALALRNRATMLERASRWPEALALAVDAYAYVSGGDRADQFSWETLSGRVHNASAGLLNAGRYDEALSLVGRAIELYGAEDGFVKLWNAARTGVLTASLRKASPAAALALAEEATIEGGYGPEVLDNAFSYAYSVLAEEMRKSGNHLGAWEVATEAQRRFPASKEMASLAGTTRSNWVISVHNRFAALYNAGRYSEAIVLVEEALELVPGERRLLDDISTARKALP
jgi:hypothetical protein